MVTYLSPYLLASAEDVLHEVGSSATEGLSAEEVTRRQAKYGLNIIHMGRLRAWKVLWRQVVGNPLIIILVAATSVSYFTGERISAVYIFGMIVLSIVLGFWNEYAAERTVQDLLKRVQLSAEVIRDGQKMEIPVSQITVGDVVMVAPGSIIPADLRLIETGNLEVDQSALTGESKTVYKTAGALAKQPAGLSDFDNIGLMGTAVTSGWGKGVVLAIDRETEFGKIAKTASFVKPETEFQKGLRGFGDLIVRVILVLAVGIFSINFLLGRPFLDSMLFSLAIAVGLTPELLPIIVTISLAHGAGKLAKKHVVSKQLISIENLGNMDILCTDKTGTLTEGHIKVADVLDAAGEPAPQLLQLGLVCNTAIRQRKTVGNAIDVALWEHAQVFGVQPPPDVTKVYEEPFDYDRQAMFCVTEPAGRPADGAAGGGRNRADATAQAKPSTGAEADSARAATVTHVVGTAVTHVAAAAHHRQLIAKGAPEAILDRCVATADTRAARERFVELGQKGLRVVALATGSVPARAKYNWDGDARQLHFVGFITLMDQPKRQVRESLTKLEQLNVAIKIVTGDSDLVTRRICSEVGLPITRVVVGAELAQLRGTQLEAAVTGANVFARVTPEQKLLIIQTLQKLGHTVGYLGDGINDIPSLRSADVGISVNTAVDVAKEAAPIVLLRRGLDTIAGGIIEGRRTFNNTIKYILMGTSSNFGNMLSAAGASFFLPFLPMAPSQILLTNALYDVSQITIPSDNVDEESLHKPRQWNVKFIRYYMLFFGPISSLYDFLTFATMLFIFHAQGALFQTGWFVESLATEILVVFIIRTARMPFYRSRPGKWLTITCLGVVGLGVALPYSPLAHGLGFVPLPPLYFLWLVLLVGTYLLLVGLMKNQFLKRFSL